MPPLTKEGAVDTSQEDAQIWIEGNLAREGKCGRPHRISALVGLKNAYYIPGFPSWMQADDFPGTFASTIDQFEMVKGGYFAAVAWSGELNSRFFIQAAQYNRATLGWTAIAPIPLAGRRKSFDVKLGSQGLTWLTWSLFTNSDHKDDIYTASPAGWRHPMGAIATLV